MGMLSLSIRGYIRTAGRARQRLQSTPVVGPRLHAWPPGNNAALADITCKAWLWARHLANRAFLGKANGRSDAGGRADLRQAAEGPALIRAPPGACPERQAKDALARCPAQRCSSARSRRAA